MSEQVWTDQQFNEMSWHDNHVHGLRVVEGVHSAGTLVLDIDYIPEWLHNGQQYKFRIVPAHLE